jgi:hypothetical protein
MKSPAGRLAGFGADWDSAVKIAHRPVPVRHLFFMRNILTRNVLMLNPGRGFT